MIRTANPGEVIAIDGKTQQSSHDRSKGLPALHPVSAWASASRVVPRQVTIVDRDCLLCWSAVGAESVATIQSLSVSWWLHNVDPYDCPVDVLQGIDRHLAQDVEQLIRRPCRLHR